MNTGIDISRWQKGISLQKAKQEGFTHIILKVGGADCGLYKDGQFDSFYNEARACQMNIVGVYFFGNAFSVAEAQKEANYCLSLVQGKSIQYIFYDVEAKMVNQGKTHLTDIIKAFCTIIKNAGYIPGVYASNSPFNTSMNDKELSPYLHWVAKYSKNAPSLLSGNKVDIWQYGGEINYIRSNKVAGYTCDQDYFYSDFNGVTIINTSENITTKSVHELALEVLDGKYGNGVDRQNNLGYRYEEVQKEVDRILKERSATQTEKTIDQLAIEVLAGVYGNGITRRIKLGSKYAEVQKRVDEIIASRKKSKKLYTVVKGDTLSKIAKRYNTTWKKLAELNNIPNPSKIYPGQQIVIA